MHKLLCLLLLLTASGVVAGSGLSAAPSATGKKPAKCVKWGKSHGKRVCVKRAKQKPAPSNGGGDGSDAPPASTAPDGHYAAATSQGTAITFDLASDNVLTFALSEIEYTCNPGAFLGGQRLQIGFAATLNDDGSFAIEHAVPYTGGGSGTLELKGTIDKSGKLTGSYTWNASFSSNGTAYSCSSGTIAFSGGTGSAAVAAPPTPTLGHYHGLTAQNDHITFDVVSHSGYFYATNVAIDEVDESCQPDANGWVKEYSFGAYEFVVQASGHMRYAYYSSDGNTTFILDMTITGASVRGTIDDSRIIQGDDGNNFACHSGAVAFTASLG